MSVTEQIEIPVPTSESDRKEIFKAIQEMSNAMARKKGEEEYIKETKKEIKKKFGIDSKWIKLMLDDYHADKFDERVHEFEEYEAFYESIINMKNNSGRYEGGEEDDS